MRGRHCGDRGDVPTASRCGAYRDRGRRYGGTGRGGEGVAIREGRVMHKNNKHQLKRDLLFHTRDDIRKHWNAILGDFMEHWNTTKPAYMRLKEEDINYLCSLEPRFVITFKPRKLEIVK